jgi:predicted N-acetyltransferase YhbS
MRGGPTRRLPRREINVNVPVMPLKSADANVSAMTTKMTHCIGQERMLRRLPSRDLNDGAPRHASLTGMVRQPWAVRVGRTSVVIRGARPRDLAAVAAMHARCTPQTLLNRYRTGGRRPAVVALELQLRQPLSFVASTYDGVVVATAVAGVDGNHGQDAAVVGLLVEDAWQAQGLGRELMSHVSGGALVCGYSEIIGYPATSVAAVQRLMIDIGHTRIVTDPHRPHLHTYLPESAALGLGPVRERLAS